MMQTKKLARIALTGAFLFCTFYSFSNVLYVEAITLMIIAISLSYKLYDSVIASIVFGVLLVLLQGPTLWNVAYLVIYPLYSLMSGLLAPFFKKHKLILIAWGFLLSFSTGMLLDLPFILVSKTVTIYYILTGIKTSFIQGIICSLEIIAILEPIVKVLDRTKGEYHEKEN